MNSVETVVVADDHPLVRAGVVLALQATDFCQVVGEAHDASQTLDLVGQHRPDVLILDLELDGACPAEELIEACRQTHPQLKVLILSGHTEPKYVVALRDITIHGFVLKSEAPDSLVQAVRVVLGGGNWYSHGVSGLLSRSGTHQEEHLIRLTPRELQVLRLMRGGKCNQAIATELGLSKQTVRRYATILYEKLGVRSRVEAIVTLESRCVLTGTTTD